MDFRLRNRARLRRKEIFDLRAKLAETLGVTKNLEEEDPVETAEGPDRTYLLLGSDIIGFLDGEKVFLTPRGLLKYGATKRYVTVDMGAVPYVSKGADAMGPGITDADPQIKADDWVFVREERHLKPLCVGRALADGPVLKTKARGKQVKTEYYVGDKVWTWGHEPEAPKTEAAPANEPQ